MSKRKYYYIRFPRHPEKHEQAPSDFKILSLTEQRRA